MLSWLKVRKHGPAHPILRKYTLKFCFRKTFLFSQKETFMKHGSPRILIKHHLSPLTPAFPKEKGLRQDGG